MLRSVACKINRRTSGRYASGFYQPPKPTNEPNFTYAKGTKERESLLNECKKLRNTITEVPVVINGKEFKTGDVIEVTIPSNTSKVHSRVHQASEQQVSEAIKGALAAREKWEKLTFEHKCSVFLRYAELLSGKYRHRIMAATMIGQSKTMWQAEIDSAAENIDFLRFNCYYASQLHANQPWTHSNGVWNRMEYRPLEGFVAAIVPFNFTAIASNLCCTPMQMGNVVLMKPSPTAILSNYVIYDILREAGLPDGVLQFLPCPPKTFTKVFQDPHFAGLHFTGSTAVFRSLWETIGKNLETYKCYPRIVGETGGKNFHLVHESANLENAVNHTLRSAFEYSGQKCSACSRLYVPQSMWTEFKAKFVAGMKTMKVGPPDSPDSFLSSVIDEKAFNKITGYIEHAKKDADLVEVIGGTYEKSVGWFVNPTLIVTKNPRSKTMVEEIFGPVLTCYVYDNQDYDKVLSLIDESSYGLTGSLFAKDSDVIQKTSDRLRNAAGNFYINDKSTGAVVGQQAFGGARLSGTNDKAGAEFALSRWASMRTIKHSYSDVTSIGYPSVDM